MKKIIIMVFLFLSVLNYGQVRHKPPHHLWKGWAKIEQLEKLKLLEILDLDEETSIRFFARKNKHHQIQKKLIEQKDSLVNVLNEIVENEQNENQQRILKIVNEINEFDIKLAENKKKFIGSLTDLLTAEQIAKMVIFESKFRREIADFIIKKRRRKPD